MSQLTPNNLKLIRTLYSQFGRFCRSKLFNDVPFRLKLDEYDNGNDKVTVDSGSALMSNIRKLFKYPVNSVGGGMISASSRIDIALNAMKHMNELKIELEERKNVHEKNKKIFHDNSSLCKFKIGQVVQLKEHEVRGVVIGWKIDNITVDNDNDSDDDDDNDNDSYNIDSNNKESKPEQIVYILCDTFDYNEIIRSGQRTDGTYSGDKTIDKDSFSIQAALNFSMIEELPASSLEIINDPELKRICNDEIHSHFDYFIPNEGRFKPNLIKNYEYASDWEDNITSPSSSSKSKDDEIYNVDKNELKNSCHRLCNAALLLGKEIKHLIEIHHLDHLQNNSQNNSEEKQNYGDKDDIIKRLLEEIFTITSNLIKQEETILKIKEYDNNITNESLLDGGFGALHNITSLLYCVDQLLQLRFQNLGLSHLEKIAFENNIQDVFEIALNRNINYHRSRPELLDYNINNILMEKDDKNTSTWQWDDKNNNNNNQGITEENDEISSNSGSRNYNNHKNDSSISIEDSDVIDRQQELFEEQLNLQQLTSEQAKDGTIFLLSAITTDGPSATMRLGTVVKHKKFGYRGIISGWDHRPLMDVSRWQGVIGLKYGSNQPFYRVIPDENDVEKCIGPNQFRNFFYAAQENLEVVDCIDDCVLNHRDIGNYFIGYNVNIGRYIAPPKLRFCFPDNDKYESSNSDSNSNDNKWYSTWNKRESGLNIDNDFDNNNINNISNNSNENRDVEDDRNQEDLEAFSKTELFLLDAYRIIRKSLIQGRKECELNDINIDINDDYKIMGTTYKNTNIQEQEQEENNNNNNNNNNSPKVLMSDIVYLLKNSIKRSDALIAENSLWHMWTSSNHVDVACLLREGVACLKRGKRDTAKQLFHQITLVDPLFAEAHNKLAALNSGVDTHEVMIRAKKCLELNPYHFGAYTGLGLAYEQQGDIDKAIHSFKRALHIHPFAGNLGTILNSLLRKNTNTSNTNNTTNTTNEDQNI